MTNNIFFIKKKKDGIILVQVYVDYIILGSTNEALCEAFVEAIKIECEIYMMGELC